MKDLSPLAERFLRYVAYDTKSDAESETIPSTAKQLDLMRLLRDECQQLGLADVEMDDYGYLTATIPATIPERAGRPIPTIGFIAHVDTSPEMSGANVKPQIHRNYDGQPIKLNAEYTLDPKDCPALLDHSGHTLITTDGTTLLGADNKAGCAEIICLAERLLNQPELPHGKIRLAFTFDEEIGKGTEHFDVDGFGADFAYTVDGSEVGEVENETFCADAALVTCKGINAHPGTAKDRLVNATKVASHFLGLLPTDATPETTEGREGFIHPISISGGVEETQIKLILRDFELEKLALQKSLLERLAKQTEAAFPKSSVDVIVEESYRNMRFVLDDYPEVMNNAMKAVERAGLTPKLHAIRGGTDGAMLSFRGLPTPNIFTGGHLYHSRYEWACLEGMELAVDTLVHLVQLWAE